MVSFLIVSIHIATNVSIFLFLNASKTHNGMTLKIFSANAMVSLLLMGLHFLILFCFKTVTKGYTLCQSAFKLLLERFVYWKSNVSIQSNSSFFTILHTLYIIYIRTLNCLRKKLKIWKNLYASKKKTKKKNVIMWIFLFSMGKVSAKEWQALKREK